METMTPSTRTRSDWVAVLRSDTNASFVAGGVAGAVSRTAVSPFERAKILFQVQGPTAQARYRGVWPTIFQMYREEGVAGLFRGNGLNCLRIFPYLAVQFAVFERLKHAVLPAGTTELNTVQRLWIGGVAGAVLVVVTYPLDLVRARLLIQTALLHALDKLAVAAANANPPGFVELLGKIYRTEGGLRAWYRGIWPTTLGVAPYVAINFAVYEQLREFIPPHDVWMKLVSGAVAGGIAQTVIYPFDLLRRRFQVLLMGQGQMGFAYTGVWHALTDIFRREGFFGAYKGLTANLYKVVPSMAVSWVCYDTLKDAIVG